MIMNNITIVVLWGFIQHINLSIQKYQNYKQRSTNLLSIVHDVVCRLFSMSFHWISASPTSWWPINILQIYYKITICIVQQFIILFMNSLKLSWSWILFTVEVERFAVLNIRSFSLIEVFAEILLRCLGQKCLFI